MNQATIEQLRIRIVLLVEATRSIGMGFDGLCITLRQAGYKFQNDDELRSEVDYLVEKGLIRLHKEDRRIGPPAERYKITADGRDWLAENHFAPTP
jgi:hypothetical protein